MPETSIKYQVWFELHHSDGTLIDRCWHDEANAKPFEFENNDGQLDECLQECIEHAKVDRLETFLLTPEEAFGQYDDDAVQTMDRKDFDPKIILEKDMAVAFDLPNGKEILGYIQTIKENEVIVDFNHLLAGQSVSFKVLVISKTVVNE